MGTLRHAEQRIAAKHPVKYSTAYSLGLPSTLSPRPLCRGRFIHYYKREIPKVWPLSGFTLYALKNFTFLAKLNYTRYEFDGRNLRY